MTTLSLPLLSSRRKLRLRRFALGHLFTVLCVGVSAAASPPATAPPSRSTRRPSRPPPPQRSSRRPPFGPGRSGSQVPPRGLHARPHAARERIRTPARTESISPRLVPRSLSTSLGPLSWSSRFARLSRCRLTSFSPIFLVIDLLLFHPSFSLSTYFFFAHLSLIDFLLFRPSFSYRLTSFSPIFLLSTSLGPLSSPWTPAHMKGLPSVAHRGSGEALFAHRVRPASPIG